MGALCSSWHKGGMWGFSRRQRLVLSTRHTGRMNQADSGRITDVLAPSLFFFFSFFSEILREGEIHLHRRSRKWPENSVNERQLLFFFFFFSWHRETCCSHGPQRS